MIPALSEIKGEWKATRSSRKESPRTPMMKIGMWSVMMFAILFGLSMDYEVFLVSRMHEEWRRTGDPVQAVREGLATTGGVITAASATIATIT